MPGKDGTGPLGSGQMTGRRGFCDGAGMQNGYGMGRGRNFNRGAGCFSSRETLVSLSEDEKKQYLQREKDFLNKRIQIIESQLQKI